MLAIVTRKSTRDEQQVSIGRQEKLGRAWAQANRPDLPVRVFADNATPGTDMERPGWTAFTTAVRSGQVDAVWAYEQSRLTRAGATTWDEVCVLLWAAGIEQLHTHVQGSIGVVEGNRLQGRILAVVDQEERERVRVRVLDAMANMADEGRPTGATGFGYRRTRDQDGRPALEPDPEQAPIVRWMVDEIAAGASLGLVARTLTERGVPTVRGGKWTSMSVKLIVTAPRIVGERVHRGRLVGPARWPAIVDRDTWDRAQARLADHRPGRTASQRRQYLLTGGLVVCGECDTALVSATTKARGVVEPSYQCPHPSRPDGGCGHCSIVARHLEPHVVTAVAELLADEDHLAELNRHLSAGRADAAPVRSALAEVEGRLVDLAERWAKGEMLDLEHAAARRSLVAQREALHVELAAHPVEVTVSAEEIAADWAAAAEAGDVAAMRPIVATLLEPVVVERAFRDGRRLTVADRVRIEPTF